MYRGIHDFLRKYKNDFVDTVLNGPTHGTILVSELSGNNYYERTIFLLQVIKNKIIRVLDNKV